MATVNFYSNLLSPPCRAVYIFLKANNIPFNYKHLELAKGDHLKEEYLKINPLGQVPAIQDGDFSIGESVAIIQYLTQRFSTPDHWYPCDLSQRAKINEFLSWHQTSTRSSAGGLFFQTVILAEFRNQPRNEAAIKELKGKLTDALNMIEKHFLNGCDFIGGNEISIADIVTIVEFVQLEHIGIDVGKTRPNIKEWRDRVVAKLGSSYTSSIEILAKVSTKLGLVEPFETSPH